MSNAAILVAAGRGLRAGGGVPKQWRPLAGRRVADWTLARFLDHPRIDRVVLVLAPEDRDAWAEFADRPGLILSEGGETRSASVRNGLIALDNTDCTKVLIHDIARPCVSDTLISSVLDALDDAPGAAPALPVTDALWTGNEGAVTGVQDRNGVFAAQTPQGFAYAAIRDAHAAAHAGEAADDVEVARAAGLRVVIVPGEPANLKITEPGDFSRAAKELQGEMDVRTGNGFDVHRFGPGDRVMLCGVAVPHERGLQGHSDADVGMHALTDAIYGALAEGDIGRHFPPSDPQWKGAESHIFLRHAGKLAAARGYALGNADVTLICERPKVGPHAEAMQAALEGILGVGPGRISVKATTSERLGFTGREEGIAALATVTLVPA
ncbi:MAG TPA: bifunctional 2-C-methyl-D-erythritol 4-phosphate cytidylyltransferase/2-C-methyl-D-erythritol 2,4-cyclodiphosphate synthase [Rhodobacteraceae bacterium]|jgi:2-C-methyl-D-erythritol 4-phosphate cytidylyltransferase/2-C-methyl-D-erythritol 2,4-cyclodiphosphate synthase|nr:bifunctional 2-C-methyl-D-erythritol 4-phosphate cytidylyltransferase/2-C-methyl-D-erythritol 2,4-cyclodiphosphate synthase [Paracoccaceae bacterium]